jgi:hypothetical protein
MLKYQCRGSLVISLASACAGLQSPLAVSLPTLACGKFITGHSNHAENTTLEGGATVSVPFSSLKSTPTKQEPFCKWHNRAKQARDCTTAALSEGADMPRPLAAVLPDGRRILSIQSHTVSVSQPPAHLVKLLCRSWRIRTQVVGKRNIIPMVNPCLTSSDPIPDDILQSCCG